MPSGHHSYPMVYRLAGKTFFIPECAEHKRVSCVDINRDGEVIGQRTLVRGHPIVDPTLFEAGGKYWLLGNPLDDWDGKLIVLSSSSLDGPWKEASFSPMTIPNCRGAGKIIHRDGSTYWFTQYNEDRYGGGLVVRRIHGINDDGFDQEPVATLLPRRRGRYPMGTHTVSDGTEHYLIDGLRAIIRPSKPLDVLIARLRRR